MDKLVGRLAILLCVMGFGVFYGVSISKDGIEQIHGPIGGQEIEQKNIAANVVTQIDPASLSVQAGVEGDLQSRSSAERIRPTNSSLFGKVFDKLGALLNLLADHLIRLLVRLGEALLS